ncbi:MAG: hypothetical protein Q8Q49_02140 [bacterium]|nr:hypothetical protein [bacterium]
MVHGERTSGQFPYQFSEFPSGKRISADAAIFYQRMNASIAERTALYLGYYQNHIDESRTRIMQAAEGLQGRALIVGLGVGIDIPLEQITTQFDEVTILDLDEHATRKRLASLPENLQEKCHLVIDDLTGITGDYTAAIMAAATHADRLPDFLEEAESISRAASPQPYQTPGQYDFITSSLITTQLVSQLHDYTEKNAKERYGISGLPATDLTFPYLLALTHLTTRAQSAYLRFLLQSCKPDGKIYYSDTVSQILLARDPQTQSVSRTSDHLVMVAEPEQFNQEMLLLFDTQPLGNWVWYQKPPSQAVLFPTQGAAFSVEALTISPKKSA